MSDPRQEAREAAPARLPSYLPTQVMERIRAGMSPCDDGLPFAQAKRQREEMQKAVEAFRKRTEGRTK